MAADRPNPFQKRAREGGPLAPGWYRVVPSDMPQNFHDFADLESARGYADDVASEGDYEDIPPTAYIYDSRFELVEEGMHFSQRAASGQLGTPSGPPVGLLARLRSLFGRR